MECSHSACGEGLSKLDDEENPPVGHKLEEVLILVHMLRLFRSPLMVRENVTW